MGIGAMLAGKATRLGQGPAPAAAPAAPAQPEAGRLLDIDPRLIQPNPHQPRQEFDREALERLAASIKEHGVIQSLSVRLEGGQVVLVAGERRQRAALMAGLTRVPCVVTDRDPAILALVENLHRQDLSPLEEAEALAKLQKEQGLGLAELAAIAGKGKSTVSELLSLNRLPDMVKHRARMKPDKFPRRLLVELAKEEPAQAEKLSSQVMIGDLSTETVRAQRREAKPPQAQRPKDKHRAKEGESDVARVDALFRRAEQLAGELLGISLPSLNYRQRANARQGLQPMARALDRLFGHLKKTANQDASRWTPELRARLWAMRNAPAPQVAVELGREINDDGQPVHPSELAAQMTLARQEALASAEEGNTGDVTTEP